MESNKLEKFIKDRFFDCLKNLETYNKEGQSLILSMAEKFKDIEEKRNSNNELKPDDVKEDLIEIQKIQTKALMLQDSMKEESLLIIEYKTICDLNSINVEITEDQTKLIDKLISLLTKIFGIYNDKVVVKDQQQFDFFISNLENQVYSKPENLQRVFNDSKKTK